MIAKPRQFYLLIFSPKGEVYKNYSIPKGIGIIIFCQSNSCDVVTFAFVVRAPQCFAALLEKSSV
jgi:hypothetical protein